eukprot:21104-Prymnesium_polylepis.1
MHPKGVEASQDATSPPTVTDVTPCSPPRMQKRPKTLQVARHLGQGLMSRKFRWGSRRRA